MNRAQSLRIAGLAGILGVAALRAIVVIEPNVWFADLDPAFDQMPLLALASSGSHVLDLVLFAAAICGLAGEWRSARGVRIGLVLLALLPVPVAAMHAHTGVVPENGFRADTWIAAMLAFVALAHLVRDRSMRVIALSVLVSLTGLLAARGAVQVLVEHPATVALYEQTREQFLATRGWLPDSSAARTYERRLMQPEATGWFGLSNPFSTMMGVGAIAFTALAVLARRMQQSGNTLMLALAALVCAWLLAVNGGKGAIGATMLAAGVLVWTQRRGALLSSRWALVCAAAMLGAVGVRWLVGTRLGELSLLLRGYYIEGGLNILSHGEWAAIGTGPERVQEYFNAAKPPNCPEDVKSLHSMFADWVVAFGVSGLAWCGLIVAALWSKRSSKRGPGDDGAATDDALTDVDASLVRRVAFLTALGAGIAGFVAQMRIEAPTVDPMWVVLRAVGVCVFALLAVCAAQAFASLPQRTVGRIALALGVLVLVHAQIETLAWMPGSCVLALALIACATDLAPPTKSRWFVLSVQAELACGGLALMAIAAMALGLSHDLNREARLESVARSLAPIATERGREYETRMAAARALSAKDFWWSRFAHEAAVDQALAAAASAKADAPRVHDALEIAREAASARQLRGPRADGLRADVAARMLRALPGSHDGFKDAVPLLCAIEDGARAMPRSPRRWIEVGTARAVVRKMWADAGMNDELDARVAGDPREAFERALAVSDALSLDPLAQLSDREVAAIRAEIARFPASADRSRSDPQR